MKLAPYLENAPILVGLDAPSSSSMLGTLVDELGHNEKSLDVDLAMKELLKRESSCSTGVGNGIAIPHATVENLLCTRMTIATLASPIDFKSLDGRPVRVVFLILSPPNQTREHVALLARIARMCSKEMFVEMMMHAENSEDLLQLMIDEDERYVG